MKKTILLLLISMFFSGCSVNLTSNESSFEKMESEMGFVISLPASNQSRYAYYSQDDVVFYDIKIIQNNNVIKSKYGFPGEKISFPIAEEGTYNIRITAFNEKNEIIAEGEKSASILKNDGYVKVYITLNPKLKSVDVFISVEWYTPEQDYTYTIASKGITINNNFLEKTSEVYIIPSTDITISNHEQIGVFYGNRIVTLSPYVMGQFEVTQELYEEVMGVNPSRNGSEENKYFPVDSANWYQAIAFCNKLSLLTGFDPVYSVNGIDNWNTLNFYDIPSYYDSDWKSATIDISKNGYRLPTEAEWEFAARGGKPESNEWNYTYAGNNDIEIVAWTSADSSSRIHEVGKKLPNSLGLYDMCGNQWEWCNDLFADIDYSTESESINPMNTTIGFEHTQRGGAWKDPAGNSMLGYRRSDRCGGGSSAQWEDWGFRICRSLTNTGSYDHTVYSENMDGYIEPPLPIPEGLTYLPANADDLGKIICSDGSILSVTEFRNSKKQPVAIVCGYDVEGNKLGLGLVQSEQVQWCSYDHRSFEAIEPLFPSITASFFRSKRTNVENFVIYEDLGFDGDLLGYDNWEQICAVDKNARKNMQENYPLFFFANNYSNISNLADTDYYDNWYIPSVYELYQIYQNVNIINNSLSVCNAELLSDSRYWSSSEWKLNKDRTFDDLFMGSAWNVDFYSGHINPEWCGKTSEYKACVIRKF